MRNRVSFRRRRLLAGAIAMTALAGAGAVPAQGVGKSSGSASAASGSTPAYPVRPIIIKVAFPPGGPADVSIRAATVILQRNLQQNLVPENLPGANGSIAAMATLNATPDGYTLLGTTGTDFLVAPLTISSAHYSPPAFKLAGVVGISDFVLVSGSKHSFANVAELIAFAKKSPTPLTIAHWGQGSAPHVVAADFQLRTGLTFVEVPYKGAAPASADVAGNQVDLTFVPLGGATLGMIQNGKFHPIGVASLKRNPALPDLPALAETPVLSGFEYSQWSALLAPPRTPEPIVTRLNSALNEWIVSPENQARVAANASRRLDPMSPAQAEAFLKAEHEKFTRIARTLKLDPQ